MGVLHDNTTQNPNPLNRCHEHVLPRRSLPRNAAIERYFQRKRNLYQRIKSKVDQKRTNIKPNPLTREECINPDPPSRYSNSKRLYKRSIAVERELKANCDKYVTQEKRRDTLCKKLRLLRDKPGHDSLKANLAKRFNDNITNNVWLEKDIIRGRKKIDNLRAIQGYSRIERAFMATYNDPLIANIRESAILGSGSAESDPNIPPTNTNDDRSLLSDDDFSMTSTTLEELKRQQQESAKLRAELISARAHISQLMTELTETSVNSSNQNQTLIAENTKLNEEAARARLSQEQLQNTLNVTLKQHSDAIHKLQRADPPGISSPIRDLLNVYHELDDDSKKALLSSAISTNNTQLQRAILEGTQGNTGTSLAKLTKELIKLAETYKVPELCFDEQANKWRYNFHTWISKLKSIIAMFPQTASVFTGDKVVFYSNPDCIGNKALFLLLGSRTDAYFQRAIKQFEGHGDKALAFIQRQCADISAMEKHYFHQVFTSIRIEDKETATNYLR
jgi:hypothetical protein